MSSTSDSRSRPESDEVPPSLPEMPRDRDEGHYHVLGIVPSASGDEITTAYRELALTYHPDRNPGFQHEANARLRTINAAYEVLSHPARRAAYDRDLTPTTARPPAGTSAADARRRGDQRLEALDERLRMVRGRLAAAPDTSDTGLVEVAACAREFLDTASELLTSCRAGLETGDAFHATAADLAEYGAAIIGQLMDMLENAASFTLYWGMDSFPTLETTGSLAAQRRAVGERAREIEERLTLLEKKRRGSAFDSLRDRAAADALRLEFVAAGREIVTTVARLSIGPLGWAGLTERCDALDHEALILGLEAAVGRADAFAWRTVLASRFRALAGAGGTETASA